MDSNPNSAPSAEQVADVIVAAYHGVPSDPVLRDVLAADVVMQDWMFPGAVVHGVDAFCEAWFDAVPGSFSDATEEILATVFDGSQLVVHARFRATFAGDHYGVTAHQGPLSWEVIDRWEIEDGSIVRVYLMANTLDAHRQLRPGGLLDG